METGAGGMHEITERCQSIEEKVGRTMMPCECHVERETAGEGGLSGTG